MSTQVFIITALFFLTGSFAYAQGLSRVEKNILGIKRLDTKISSIEIEMKLPLASNPDHRKWRYPSQKAIEGLDKTKKDLDQLILASEVKDLRLKFHGAIDALKKVYNGIERKSFQQIEKDYGDFYNQDDQFKSSLKDKSSTHFKSDLPKDFSVTNEELKLFRSDVDRGLYEQSLSLIKQKKFQDANTILQGLLESYQGHILEGSIVSLIVEFTRYRSRKSEVTI